MISHVAEGDHEARVGSFPSKESQCPELKQENESNKKTKGKVHFQEAKEKKY